MNPMHSRSKISSQKRSNNGKMGMDLLICWRYVGDSEESFNLDGVTPIDVRIAVVAPAMRSRSAVAYSCDSNVGVRSNMGDCEAGTGGVQRGGFRNQRELAFPLVAQVAEDSAIEVFGL